MKNENVTITLPKEKYDNLLNLVDAQEKQMKELLSAKEGDIIVVDFNMVQTGLGTTLRLPTIISGNKEMIRALLFDKLSLTREEVEAAFRFKIDAQEAIQNARRKEGGMRLKYDTLLNKLNNYNKLPWWKKIFTFSL